MTEAASQRRLGSGLYIPGPNERAIENAPRRDALILDLEDSAAPAAKAQARERVCGLVAAGAYDGR